MNGNAHQWHDWNGLECCRVCGIVRRRDDKNTPCKGPTRVGPRGEAAYGWNDGWIKSYCLKTGKNARLWRVK